MGARSAPAPGEDGLGRGSLALPFFDAMVAGLADPSFAIRIEAAGAIAALGPADRRGIGALTARLHHADERLAGAAVCALSKLGALPAGTVDALRLLARPGDGRVRDCLPAVLHPRPGDSAPSRLADQAVVSSDSKPSAAPA